MELATHCREGTWSCDVEVAGCQGRNSQLAADGCLRVNDSQPTALQSVVARPLRRVVRSLYTSFGHGLGVPRHTGRRPKLPHHCGVIGGGPGLATIRILEFVLATYLKRSFAGASGTIGDSGISPFHASLIAGMTRSTASCET